MSPQRPEITPEFLEEKNKETNQPIVLFTIYDYDGQSNNLYLTQSKEDVTFDGTLYSAYPITFDRIGENSQGEIGQLRVSISNVNRIIQSYLEVYDFHKKKVKITVVFRNLLSDPDCKREDIFYVKGYTSNAQAATFTLSSRFDVLHLKIPLRTYFRTRCGWKEFGGTECGYSGSETECNRTLQRCRELNNSARYGGFPSIPTDRFFI